MQLIIKNLFFHRSAPVWLLVLSVCCFNYVSAQEFWGATTTGGKYGAGTVYKTDANGENYEVVHHFHKTGIGNIYDPEPVLADNGKLYGVRGTSPTGAAIYEIDPESGKY